MNSSYVLIYLISVLIASFSQIMLKKSAKKVYNRKVFEIVNPVVIGAYSLFMLSMLLTTFALRGVDYKYSGVIESVGYIFILVLSILILKEKATKKKIWGNIIIIIGIIIFTL